MVKNSNYSETFGSYIRSLRIKNDIGQRELAKKIGISPASASRNVAVLSKWIRHDKKGHDLVVSWENPKKRVEKFVKLTSKGERFMQELKKAFVQ